MRVVKCADGFDEALVKVQAAFPHARAFVTGAEWVLVRDPTRGQQIGERATVWCIPIIEQPGFPSVVLYYAFTEKHLLLISIQVIHRKGEANGKTEDE